MSNRKFGVEIETAHCPGWEYSYPCGFTAVHDGPANGMEFKSPILEGQDGLDHIHRFLNARPEWHANHRECGLHVHMDMRDERNDSLRAILAGYLLTELFWFGLVDESRHKNSYCESLRYRVYLADIEKAPFRLSETNRFDFETPTHKFDWLNSGSLYRGTFENRLHHGTTDPFAITNWVKANLKFVDAVCVMSFDEVVAKFSGLNAVEQFRAVTQLWDDNELTDYYRARAMTIGRYRPEPIPVPEAVH